jgi:hypothetical protein
LCTSLYTTITCCIQRFHLILADVVNVLYLPYFLRLNQTECWNKRWRQDPWVFLKNDTVKRLLIRVLPRIMQVPGTYRHEDLSPTPPTHLPVFKFWNFGRLAFTVFFFIDLFTKPKYSQWHFEMFLEDICTDRICTVRGIFQSHKHGANIFEWSFGNLMILSTKWHRSLLLASFLFFHLFYCTFV